MNQSNLKHLVNEATPHWKHTHLCTITIGSLDYSLHYVQQTYWENLSHHRTSSLLQLWQHYFRLGRSKNWNPWPVMFARWSKQSRERTVQLIRVDHGTPPRRACPKTKSENSKAENLPMVRRRVCNLKTSHSPSWKHLPSWKAQETEQTRKQDTIKTNWMAHSSEATKKAIPAQTFHSPPSKD